MRRERYGSENGERMDCGRSERERRQRGGWGGGGIIEGRSRQRETGEDGGRETGRGSEELGYIIFHFFFVTWHIKFTTYP
jgi:hypothetical protein